MAQKTYFLMPNFNYQPDKYLKLGQLIKSHDNPLELLSEPLEPLPERQNLPVRGWGVSKSDGHRFSIGIFTQFLAQIFGIGADIDATTFKQITSRIDADELDTQFFEPNDDYVARSAGRDKVKEYLQQHPFKPIFMITGLKIVRGAKYSSTTSTYVEGAAQVGFDASVFSGVPVQAGPKMKVTKSRAEQMWFDGSADFIYAYRLQRVIVTWRRRTIKNNLYSVGANTLSHGDDLEEENEEVIDEDIEGDAEIEDISLDDCDYGSVKPIPSEFELRQAIDEEDGVDCQVLIKTSLN